MCRQVIDAFAVKKDIAAVRCHEAADNPQRCRLAAARRAEQRDELSVRDAEIDVIQHLFTVKRNHDVFERNDILFFHTDASPLAVRSSFPHTARQAVFRLQRKTGIVLAEAKIHCESLRLSAGNRGFFSDALRKGFFTILCPDGQELRRRMEAAFSITGDT